MTEIIQEPINIVDTSSNSNVPQSNEQPITQANTQATQPIVSTPSSIDTKQEVLSSSETVVIEPVKTDPETKAENLNPNWKKDIVGDDEDLLKTMDRFQNPKEMVKALKEARKLISSTRAIPELAADAKPEEIAKYRETYGIPSDPKEYNLEMDIPEEYKGAIDKYLEVAHQNNRPTSLVKNAIADYFKMEEANREHLTNKIFETQKASEEKLKADWGPLYKTNMETVTGFFEKTFGGTSQDILDAYLPDGTRIGDNAQVMANLLEVSKNTLGVSTIISNNMTRDITDLSKQLENLNNMALNGNSVYWGANHEKFKAEREQLISQIENIKNNRS